MEIYEVKSPKDWKQFHQVPALIYSYDKKYVPHLRQDVEQVLGASSPLNKGNNVKLFLLKQGKTPIGRCAAFYEQGKTAGSMGFFECIDDLNAAEMLFKACEDFLKEAQCDSITGPINFGERDKFWGLMIKGFDGNSYQENYNPPYYRKFFEHFGFEIDFEQSTQEVSPSTFNLSHFEPLEARLRAQGFTLRHYSLKASDKFANDFADVYNRAWAIHEHFEELSAARVKALLNKLKPVLREDLIWFTYKDERPVAFYVSIGELNEWFRYVNGNLNWWGKIKFLYYRWKKPMTKVRGLIFGVVPEFQGKGITSGMVMKMFEIIKNDPHLVSNELAWIGDFNPKMLNFLRRLGAVETKRHATFKKSYKSVD
jgi:GNAT superfamily N-acetyltransferase